MTIISAYIRNATRKVKIIEDITDIKTKEVGSYVENES